MNLAGQTALVTGASRGLGAAIALDLAQRGAVVAIGYRVQRSKAERVADSIRAAGGACLTVQIDVTHSDSVQAAIDTVMAERSRIDLLVCNAGVSGSALFAMDDASSWDEVVGVNLLGAARCARAVVRPMIAAGGGRIIFVGSIAGHRAQPGSSAYAASKGGLIALTRTLGAELAARGVRVNAVVPGMLDIGMAARTPPDVQRAWTAHLPTGRPGTGAEVAAAVAWLASEASSYVVGHALVVDGGLSL
jgi:3-oxoacyl-[acyl-carrier protein] reductase